MNKPKLPDGWTYHTRETGLLEGVCPCGVGHPLPKAFQPKTHQNSYSSVHGCCGCCSIFKDIFQTPEPEVL